MLLYYTHTVGLHVQPNRLAKRPNQTVQVPGLTVPVRGLAVPVRAAGFGSDRFHPEFGKNRSGPGPDLVTYLVT